MVGGWEELEQKIIRLVKSNADLKSERDKALLEHDILKEKVEQLELQLLKEHENVRFLEDEKKAMKSSIDVMLGSISSLENA